MAKTIQARVLYALPSFGAACNDVLQGPDTAINALQAAGLVDPDPASVAYATTVGQLIKLADPAGAAELGAAMTDTAAPAAA